MINAVAQTTPSRKPRRSPLDYSHRELRLMMFASTALLGGRAPALSAPDLAEAERLLDELDAANADPERVQYTPPDEDQRDDEHEEGCNCHQCDDEPAYRADDEYDIARDRTDDRWVS